MIYFCGGIISRLGEDHYPQSPGLIFWSQWTRVWMEDLSHPDQPGIPNSQIWQHGSHGRACCVNGAETGLRTVQICFTRSGFRLGVDSQTVLPKKTMFSPAGGRGGEVGLCCSQMGNVGGFSQTWMGFENNTKAHCQQQPIEM
jgi:hypothetical protein